MISAIFWLLKYGVVEVWITDNNGRFIGFTSPLFYAFFILCQKLCYLAGYIKIV